uniref:RES domain-containing protein n=1 Tax=Mesocestoides corti TaxID=53468 RepID=A0A5K3G1U9_MESCO
MPLERRETRDWLRPGGLTCLRPNPTPQRQRVAWDRLTYAGQPRGYLACAPLDRLRRLGKLCDVRMLASSSDIEC